VLNNIDVHAETKFWIGLDLAALPEYARRPDYIKQNLVITSTGMKTVADGPVLSRTQFMSKLTDETDIKLSEKCTHFIQLYITEIEGASGELALSLKKQRPGWIAECTHEDAANAENIRSKTYGLDNIAAGMEDAYHETAQPLFFKDLKVDLIKKQ
jgi:hypothetical protein